MTKDYIGTKKVTAWQQQKIESVSEDLNKQMDGYAVKYADGYTSWSPKEVFENTYFPLTNGHNNKISIDDVRNFIKQTEVSKIGDKTTVVRAILLNGFEIIECSSCVDPANYDEELGKKYAMEKIEDKIFMLLGFLLQTATNGIKG